MPYFFFNFGGGDYIQASLCQLVVFGALPDNRPQRVQQIKTQLLPEIARFRGSEQPGQSTNIGQDSLPPILKILRDVY